MKKIPVIAVCGATASGKTALGIHIAKKYGAQIISADSMQIYRGLNIGTAKPDLAEREGIVHRMMDIIDPWESYSVADYCQRAHEEIRDVVNRGCIPVIVGGTGLYMDNLIANTDFSAPKGDGDIRERLLKEADEKGGEYLYARLLRLDPKAAESVHPNNLKRIIRTLELLEITGETREALDKKSKQASPYDALWLSVEHPRDVLYERINKRVDIMLEKGLVNEVKEKLLPVREKATTALQAIGYKEILEYLDGATSLDEAAEKIKLNSRRYAKRQITWFKRNTAINRLNPATAAEEAEKIINIFLERGNYNEIFG